MISLITCVSFADALNILVVGAADLRHVLKTIAKRKSHHIGDLNVSIFIVICLYLIFCCTFIQSERYFPWY